MCRDTRKQTFPFRASRKFCPLPPNSFLFRTSAKHATNPCISAHRKTPSYKSFVSHTSRITGGRGHRFPFWNSISVHRHDDYLVRLTAPDATPKMTFARELLACPDVGHEKVRGASFRNLLLMTDN